MSVWCWSRGSGLVREEAGEIAAFPASGKSLSRTSPLPRFLRQFRVLIIPTLGVGMQFETLRVGMQLGTLRVLFDAERQ
jgi:hypothetical protein